MKSFDQCMKEIEDEIVNSNFNDPYSFTDNALESCIGNLIEMRDHYLNIQMYLEDLEISFKKLKEELK